MLTGESNRFALRCLNLRVPRIDVAAATAWISQRPLVNGHLPNTYQGINAAGWEDDTWILHPMYEDLSEDSGENYDDRFKERLISEVPESKLGELEGPRNLSH